MSNCDDMGYACECLDTMFEGYQRCSGYCIWHGRQCRRKRKQPVNMLGEALISLYWCQGHLADKDIRIESNCSLNDISRQSESWACEAIYTADDKSINFYFFTKTLYLSIVLRADLPNTLGLTQPADGVGWLTIDLPSVTQTVGHNTEFTMILDDVQVTVNLKHPFSSFSFNIQIDDADLTRHTVNNAVLLAEQANTAIRKNDPPRVFSLPACKRFVIENIVDYDTKRHCDTIHDPPEKIVDSFSCVIGSQRLQFHMDNSQRFYCGSSGLIVYYKASYLGRLVYLCVKHTCDLEDITFVKSFQKNNVKCGQVDTKILYNRLDTVYHYKLLSGNEKALYVGFFAYAMPVFTGSLAQFRFKQAFSSDDLANIVWNLLNQLDCLKQKGMCYMDIKLGNILYLLPKTRDGKIQLENMIISLGDLGSHNISTYHCPLVDPQRAQHPDCERGSSCQQFNVIVVLAELYLSSDTYRTYAFAAYAKRGTASGVSPRDALASASEFVRKHFDERFQSMLLTGL